MCVQQNGGTVCTPEIYIQVGSGSCAPTTNTYLQGVSCPSTTWCMAVGYESAGSGNPLQAIAEMYTNGGWTIRQLPKVTGSSSTYLNSVSCVSSSACTAVGYYLNGSGVPQVLIFVYDGSSWTSQSAPIISSATSADLASVSCAPTCQAVGSYTLSNGQVQVLAEGPNAQGNWVLEPVENAPGGVSNVFAGVSCLSSNSCIAVGSWYGNYNGGPYQTQTLYETFNGTSWVGQGAIDPSTSDTYFDSVSCVPGTQSCVAVGSYDDAAGNLAPLAETFSFTTNSWSVDSLPIPPNGTASYLSGVSCATIASCSAVGYYTTSQNAPNVLIETLGSSGWTIQPSSDPNGGVYASLQGVSCIASNGCMAVGYYEPTPASSHALSETYDGSRWSNVPTP